MSLRSLQLMAVGAVLTAWAFGGARASASVVIGPRIEVTGPGARATISRAPLRITFQDASGHTVLSEIAAPPGPTPTPVLPAPSGLAAPPLPQTPLPQALPPATS